MRTNQFIPLISLFFLLLATGCSSGSCECPDCYANVDKAAVEAEIQSLTNSMIGAMMSQDREGFMSYYGQDVVSLPPGRAAEIGRETIEAGLDKAWAEPTPPGMSFAVDRMDMWVLGDYAVETGSFTFDMEGMEEPSSGKFMNLFHKEDGKYVCVRDIWNYDTMPEKEEEKGEEEIDPQEGHDHD